MKAAYMDKIRKQLNPKSDSFLLNWRKNSTIFLLKFEGLFVDIDLPLCCKSIEFHFALSCCFSFYCRKQIFLAGFRNKY